MATRKTKKAEPRTKLFAISFYGDIDGSEVALFRDKESAIEHLEGMYDNEAEECVVYEVEVLQSFSIEKKGITLLPRGSNLGASSL